MSNLSPVIIIGAGRSGTNMLRDIITSIDGFETWDCDEINPLWRYGNRDFPTDELTVDQLTPKIKTYIRDRFDKLQKETKGKVIVEKTCANSLRIRYINEIFPHAKFIIINRDGRDVVPSAMQRWVSSFDFTYTLKKLKQVPVSDLFYYISRFGINRIKKMVTKTESLSFWGPLYNGIATDVKEKTLMEVCALQWKNCAEKTIFERKYLQEERIFDMRYEEFVKNPKAEMQRLGAFLDVTLDDGIIDELTKGVSDKSVGSHKKIFTAEELVNLESIMAPTLLKLGYEV